MIYHHDIKWTTYILVIRCLLLTEFELIHVVTDKHSLEGPIHTQYIFLHTISR